MFKKTINYTDYNGEERTEDFYFDLNEAEITEMELSQDGGLSNMINKIVGAKDMPSLIKLFKGLILKSYGVKSADGRRFIKSDDLSTEFTQTRAYSKLFMELATDEAKAAEFINSIVPQDVAAKSKELASKK